MFNIIMLVVFSLVTLFYAFYVASQVRFAASFEGETNKKVITRSIVVVVISILTLAILWFQAAFIYFYH